MSQSEIILEGVIKSVRRFDSGWAIVRLEPKTKGKRADEQTIVGDIAFLSEGMSIRAHVIETEHPKYGLQYKAVEVHESGFANIEGLVNYLASKSFHGIGKVYGANIVSHFQAKVQNPNDAQEILEKIDQDPREILQAKGVPVGVASKMSEIWDEARQKDKNIAEVMSIGLSHKLAMKVIDHFNPHNALDIIKANYYELTKVPTIGFVTADEIALRNGVARNSDTRISAAITYIVDQAQVNGHCYLLLQKVGQEVVKLIGSDCSLLKIGECAKSLATKGEIVIRDSKVYLTSIWYAEQYVAQKLKDMLASNSTRFVNDRDEFERILEPIAAKHNIQFADRQKDALYEMLASKVSIITGGPGTGKTTITRCAIELFQHFGIEFALCSPTGMAAERLAQATLQPAKTIHRLLEYDPKIGGFTRSEHNPLDADCVIVDETSMVDLMLFRSLIGAVPEDSKLIMIGDADQLPSVGAGNILRDLIASKVIPVVRLDVIFRQDKGSEITLAAWDILHGNMPELPSPRESKGRNCMFVSAEDPDVLKSHLSFLVTKTLTSPSLGFNWEQIQILTPMRGKGLGVEDLNPMLQNLLNPASDEKTEIMDNFRIFRVGDRVMQTRNDYDKNVFNGFIGKIAGITRTNDSVSLFVKFQSRDDYVEYVDDDRDDLSLAYAQTIHKAQGGEYPAVIMVIHPSQYVMLKRNLLYTGLTRARKLCVIIGTEHALETAVANNEEVKRNTTLKQLLQDDAL